jgi:hypothetical protein
MKINLSSGFIQIHIHPWFHKYNGIYYEGQQYQLTKQPTGHVLAPSIMQHTAQATAHHLHRH